jgi:S-adenosylmethionine hydrolase
MARSQNSFIKKQKAEKKRKKQAEKLAKRLDKKKQETSGSLDDMIAYVDEFGNIVDTPEEAAPEEHKSSEEDEGKE